MTLNIKKLLGELEQLPEHLQNKYVSKWLHELKQGDGALGEPELRQKTKVAFEDIQHLLGVYDTLPADLSTNT